MPRSPLTAISIAGNLRSGRWQAVLGALIIADMVFGFQQTAITPALPAVQHDLNASKEWTAWLFSGYLIVASVTPVFLGKLADRSGKRNVYILALCAFLMGSIGAALSPTIRMVVIFRVIQGFGGVVFPLSFSIARDLLPEHLVNNGIGLLTSAFGLGSVGGYLIGGLIAQLLSWRWVFGVGAVALAFGIVLVRTALPRSAERAERSLDTPGAALFGGAMALLIIAITEGPGFGWLSPLVITMFVLAVAALVSWCIRELSTREPLIDLRVLKSRTMLLTYANSLLSGYTLFSVNLILPFLIESSGTELGLLGLTAGPLLTGFVLLPRALGQSFAGPITGFAFRQIGQRKAFALGTALLAGGAAGLAATRSSLWVVFFEVGALGVGFGLVISVSGVIVTWAVRSSDTGIATSLNAVLRRVGGGIGAQISAAVLTTIAQPGSDAPSTEAFTVSFAAAGATGIVAVLCALFVSSHDQRGATQVPNRC